MSIDLLFSSVRPNRPPPADGPKANAFPGKLFALVFLPQPFVDRSISIAKSIANAKSSRQDEFGSKRIARDGGRHRC